MHLPLLAVAGLAVGPALYAVPHWRRWDRMLDGFTLAAVGGLCALHLLPVALEHGGWWALPVAIFGMVLPRLLGRLEGAGPWALLLGLIAHATIESAAMGSPDGHAVLGLAVVLHRVPVGLAVFALYHEHPRTSGMGWLAIGALMLATVLGYVAGPAALEATGHTAQAGLEALVAGMLLHVVWEHGESPHDHDHDHDHDHVPPSRGGWPSTLATCLGIGLVVLVTALDPHGAEVSRTALWMGTASAPFLLLGLTALAATRGAGPGAVVMDRVVPWWGVLVLGAALFTPRSLPPLPWWSPVFLVAMGIVALFSLNRQGPRGMIARLALR